MKIEEEVARVFSANTPDRIIRGVKMLADEGATAIVRVYSHARAYPDLRPTPYRNFRFSKTSQALIELDPQEQERYKIQNYK